MTIVQSFWVKDSLPQADGRFRITETHVDQLGVNHISSGLYDASYNPDDELSLRAAIVDASLKGAEIATNVILGRQGLPGQTFNFSTEADYTAALVAEMA